MKKMLVLTPEQWAQLQRGTEQVLNAEIKREKELTDYVKKLDLKSLPKKPENFDRFQTLFHRFISDQKKARAPIAMEIKEDRDEWEDVDSGDDNVYPDDSKGGTSFTRRDKPPPFRHDSAEPEVQEEEEDGPGPSSYGEFANSKIKNRKSIKSTPRTVKTKKRRRGPDVSIDLDLVKAYPQKKLRTKATAARKWESLPS